MVESRHSRRALSEEEPYCRRQKVTAEWQPVDTGWVAGGVGMLVVTNATRFSVQPTPEEAAAAVVEVGLLTGDTVVAFARVRPGESLRAEPSEARRWRLRCAGGGFVRLGVFPA